MFKKKTVFVIGAGCSFEYGLPLGDSLKGIITKLLAQARDSRNRHRQPSDLVVVRSTGPDRSFVEAVDVISEGQWPSYKQCLVDMVHGIDHATSIDRYLDFNRGEPRIVELGKLAIARAILKAEVSSSLVLGDSGHLDTATIKKKAKGPYWLGQLFERMMEGVDRSDIAQAFENVSFVCFNYDRCIEHYLFNALRAIGRFDEDEVALAMQHLRIFHPYGQIGLLDWQAGQGKKNGFGRELMHPEGLVELSQGIKLYTEQADSLVLQAIHGELMSAGQVVFMGFSFLKQNMDLLTLTAPTRSSAVYGTAFNESTPNKRVAENLIREALRGQGQHERYTGEVELTSMTAGEFMAAYGNLLRG